MKTFKDGILVGIVSAAILSSFAYAAPAKGEDEDPKYVYMQVSLIEASGEGEEAAEFPAEIEKVIGKLRSLFKFTRYRIIGRADAAHLVGSTIKFSSTQLPEKARIRQTIPLGEDNVKRRVNLPVNQFEAFFEVSARIAGINGNIVSLADLEVNVVEPRRAYLKAGVNIRDGETLVLGASRPDTGQEALIVIVTVKLL